MTTYTPGSRVRVPERTSMLRYTPDGRGVAAVMTGVSSPAAGVGGWAGSSPLRFCVFAPAQSHWNAACSMSGRRKSWT